VPTQATSHRGWAGLQKLAAGVGIAAVALLHISASPRAGAAESPADAWLFVGLAPAAVAAVQVDLAQVVPAARPLLHSLAGAVEFDSTVSHCRGAATSCSIPHSGLDARWGIHLDAQTTSATYPSNRFLVYHEIGHAVWGLLLDDAHHQAFARAVRTALRGRPCIDGLGRPCAALGEVFADEFARFAGDFAVSISFYWTPSIFDTATFGGLVVVRGRQ